MSATWADLDDALKRGVPTMWWRDDDAIAPTPALTRLMDMADQVGAPLTLAVIPAHATEALADEIRGKAVSVAVHGWSHTNHAPQGKKKAEFGADRPAAELVADASRGKETLDRLFGPQALPLFIPPWNRMADSLPGQLSDLGFGGVSAFAQREMAREGGLVRFDAHIDPIEWRGSRSAVPEQNLLAHLIALLESDAPIGLMTHHLVHDEAIWSLTERLVYRLTQYGANWISAPYLMTRAMEKTKLRS